RLTPMANEAVHSNGQRRSRGSLVSATSLAAAVEEAGAIEIIPPAANGSAITPSTTCEFPGGRAMLVACESSISSTSSQSGLAGSQETHRYQLTNSLPDRSHSFFL